MRCFFGGGGWEFSDGEGGSRIIMSASVGKGRFWGLGGGVGVGRAGLGVGAVGGIFVELRSGVGGMPRLVF